MGPSTDERRAPRAHPTTVGGPLPRRLLGVWAHPDDEAYLTAGLMDGVVGAGGQVTLLTLTDGELGFPEDDRRPAGERARQRRSELRAAMAAVGVRDVRFLGIADGRLARADHAAVVHSIAEVIASVRPEVVVTFGPDGITGHEDHVACSHQVTEAWGRAGGGDLWYAAKTEAWLEEWRDLHDRFGVWMTDEPEGVADDRVELVLDLAGDDLERKRAVLAHHASQTVGLAEAFGEATYRRWIAQEVFRRPTAAEREAHGSSPSDRLAGSGVGAP